MEEDTVMNGVSRHILHGASYLFDLSFYNSRMLRQGLAGKYSLRGQNSDAAMLMRDAGRIAKDAHVSFAALRARYEQKS